MILGILRETYPGEKRVAIVPANLGAVKSAGLDILIEAEAGAQAGYPDAAYQEKGAQILENRVDIFQSADIIVYIRGLGANPEAGRADLALMRPDQAVIGLLEPLSARESIQQLADRKVVAFALELMPRITRAQNMDVLSSMATVAGYKAVLLAAEKLPRMFPMLMTAAGTVTPAHVFVVGAGVAGLQAIATAKRLGAVVCSYDVRPAVKEQVVSLGAKFIELGLAAANAETAGGYAREMGEEFLRRQREMMAKVVAESDVVIATAAVPGKRAPLLVTSEMVAGMRPGSVIVDLAAEQGGNCELTKPDEIAQEGGVVILGPTNLPSTVPYHASQMYSKNVTNFLLHLIKDGQLQLDADDEIIRRTMVTRRGEVLLKEENP